MGRSLWSRAGLCAIILAIACMPSARPSMRPAFLAAALIACVSSGLARAQAVDAGSQSAIQSVITQQLEAFKAGDGTAAEAFASPGIREKFPDPAGFMGMVRQSYGALVGPKSTRFGDLSQTPLGLVQTVTVVDSTGQVWTAAYTMTLVDGQWRISGCYMLKSDAVST
jgi:hypothetical protein